MAVKVYGWAISPFVSRALLCLEEGGVDYELVTMSREAGDHRRPDHLARNVRTTAATTLLLLRRLSLSWITDALDRCLLSVLGLVAAVRAGAGARGRRHMLYIYKVNKNTFINWV
jgi:hypothetical protein